MEASWNQAALEKTDMVYNVEIKIFANDRKGLLLEVTKVLSEESVNINSITANTAKNGVATLTISFDTKGIAQLDEIMRKLRQLPNVIDIERSKG